MLLVVNPVGTGYSFMEDTKLLAMTDVEAAVDLITLLKEIFNKERKPPAESSLHSGRIL